MDKDLVVKCAEMWPAANRLVLSGEMVETGDVAWARAWLQGHAGVIPAAAVRFGS